MEAMLHYRLQQSVPLASAVLLGGTTNWVTGFFFIVVYLMMAAGFWFHELEELDVDAEEFWHSHNGTSAQAVYALTRKMLHYKRMKS